MSLQLVSLCECLRALFASVLSLFVVLVELVFVEVETGDKVHGAHPAVKVTHLMDLLHVVPQLLLVREHSLAEVTLFAERRLLLFLKIAINSSTTISMITLLLMATCMML